MTKEEREKRSALRSEFLELRKKYEEEGIPILLVGQVNEELIMDAILPEELDQVDYHDRFKRMLAHSTNFNIAEYE